VSKVSEMFYYKYINVNHDKESMVWRRVLSRFCLFIHESKDHVKMFASACDEMCVNEYTNIKQADVV